METIANIIAEFVQKEEDDAQFWDTCEKAEEWLRSQEATTLRNSQAALRAIATQSIDPAWTHEQAFIFMRSEARKALGWFTKK